MAKKYDLVTADNVVKESVLKKQLCEALQKNLISSHKPIDKTIFCGIIKKYNCIKKHKILKKVNPLMKGKNMEENFEELFNKSIQNVELGKTVTGTVISISSKNEIFVDLGYKSDGIIPYKEYTDEEGKDPRNEFKPGDEITADILKMNDGIGNILLSYKRVKQREERASFEEKIKNNEIITEKVKAINEKGLILEHSGIRIFIPYSLSGILKNEDKNSYIGREVEFVITEYGNGRVIGSIKELQDREKTKIEEEFWVNAEEGKTYTGTVKAISTYGAFVEIEKGIQGLLHISEITWERNANPQDFLKEEEQVEVAIKELDKENKRLKLTLLSKGENPWNSVEEKYKVNDIVEVKITKLMNFGAFAELEPGVEGLIHISQISSQRIAKPEEKLTQGQVLNAKIINIDLENKKIELSVKELEGTSEDLEFKEEVEQFKAQEEVKNENPEGKTENEDSETEKESKDSEIKTEINN